MANKIAVKVQAKLDASNSARDFQSDLDSMIKNIKPVKIQVQFDKLDTRDIDSQIDQATRQIQNTVSASARNIRIDPIDMSNIFKFSKNPFDMTEQLNQYTAQLNKFKDNAVATWKAISNAKGQLQGAKVSYFDNNSQSTVTETFKITQAMNDAGEAVKRLALDTTSYSQNTAKANQQAEQLASKLEIIGAKYKSFQAVLSNNSNGIQLGNLNQDYVKGIENALGSSDLANADKYLKLLQEDYRALNNSMTKDFSSTAAEKMSQNLSKIENSIAKTKSQFEKLNQYGINSNFDKSTQNVVANIKNLDSLMERFKVATNGDEKVEIFNQLQDGSKKAATGVKDLINAQVQLNRVMQQAGNFSKYLKENPQALKNYADQIQNIKVQLSSLFQETDPSKLSIGLKEVSSEISGFKGQVREAGLEGRTTFGELGNDIKKMVQWTLGGTVIFGSMAGVKQAFSDIKNLDSAMVELKKVTDDTSATYAKFYQNANTDAKSLGTTTQSMMEETASWGQMGFKVPEAENLAKYSEILKNISENMSASDATDTIISSMKAFGINTNDVMNGIISKINEVNKPASLYSNI